MDANGEIMRSGVREFVIEDLEHIIKTTDILILAAEGYRIIQLSLRGLRRLAKGIKRLVETNMER